MNAFATATVLALAMCSSFAAAAIEYRQVEDDSCEALQFYAQNITAGSVWVLDDMVVDENLLHVLDCNPRSGDKEGRLASDNTKWPGGVIPYVIDSSIPTQVYINDVSISQSLCVWERERERERERSLTVLEESRCSI